MLFLVDKPKILRVMRVEEDGPGNRVRELLGVVAKADLQVPDELQARLSSQESTQLSEILSLYSEAGNAARRAAVLNFPSTVRDILSYFEGGSATEAERQLVSMTLREATRLLRRMAEPGPAHEAEAH